MLTDGSEEKLAGAWIEHATQGFSVPRSTTELPGLKRLEKRPAKGRKYKNYRDAPLKVKTLFLPRSIAVPDPATEFTRSNFDGSCHASPQPFVVRLGCRSGLLKAGVPSRVTRKNCYSLIREKQNGKQQQEI